MKFFSLRTIAALATTVLLTACGAGQHDSQAVQTQTAAITVSRISAPLDGTATVFVLLGLPFRPGNRHGYFLQLLLPYLHMALLRVPAAADHRPGRAAPERALSAREVAILERVREGRTNEEVALALGISALTVKNHLQRVYRVLGVANRAQAVARCLELRLL